MSAIQIRRAATCSTLCVAALALVCSCGPPVVTGVLPTEVESPTLAADAPESPPSNPVDPPAEAGALAPGIFATQGGEVLLVWMERVPEGESEQWRLQWSAWDGNAWSAAETIVSGSNFFANWADTPQIARDGRGRTLVSFARKSGADPYAYDVVLARKDGPEAPWRVLGSPHHDGTQTEHGFVSLVPVADGIQAVWLDGRHYASPAKGPMTLRTAFVGDGVGEEVELDGRVCDCCNTAAALSDQGLVVVYRDRDPAEVRDMSVVRAVGADWSPPDSLHADGWTIAGCPVNGPAILTDGPTAWTVWYTGADEKGTVRAAVAPGGAAFGPAITIAEGVGEDAPLGRLSIASLGDGEVAVVWLEGVLGAGVWRARRLSAQGALGPVVDIVPASRARTSGFARVVRAGDELLFVFTEVGEKQTRLRALRLAPSRIPAVESNPQR